MDIPALAIGPQKLSHTIISATQVQWMHMKTDAESSGVAHTEDVVDFVSSFTESFPRIAGGKLAGVSILAPIGFIVRDPQGH